MRVLSVRGIYSLELTDAEARLVRGQGWGWHGTRECGDHCNACSLLIPHGLWWTLDVAKVAQLRVRAQDAGVAVEISDPQLLAQLDAAPADEEQRVAAQPLRYTTPPPDRPVERQVPVYGRGEPCLCIYPPIPRFASP